MDEIENNICVEVGERSSGPMVRRPIDRDKRLEFCLKNSRNLLKSFE